MLASLIAAAFIAFPSDGQRFPNLDRIYVIGSVPRGVTNVQVQGVNREVYRTGAWTALAEVQPGTNVIEVAIPGGETTNVSVFVAEKAPSSDKPSARPPYPKLECAGDIPQGVPTNLPPEEITIVIDAGHGGKDRGAVSPHGFNEKDANLLVAKQVVKCLREMGYKAALTREDDRFIELQDRPRLAHELKAAAFVSIHHNAPGYSTDPADVRFHATYAWNDIGKRLASAINLAMVDALADDVQDKGVIHANFVVTRNPEIPSCLVEVDFISSPAGEADVFSSVRRAYISRAIARGIAAWASGS